MRIISSLAAAAAVLADQAADRLDAWVENTTDTEAPRETPLGFTPATGTDAPDPEAIINAAASRGLAGEQRDRWLAEVKERLDVSTGGPWCTEERDTPTGRIISPYGVIATGVTREADRDLIENARADLYGMLALAKHDDEVIKAWEDAAASHAGRRSEAERELQGMHYRERQVDKVVAAWDTKRGGLNGYDGTIDPETPAGRVVELLRQLCHVRPRTTRDILDDRGGALDNITANLRDYGITVHDPDDLGLIVSAVSSAVRDRAEALQQLRTIDNALTMYDDGRDPMTMALKHPADTAARVAEALSVAGRKLDAHHRHDAATDDRINPAAQSLRDLVAAEINDAADISEQVADMTPADGEADEAAAAAFIGGLRAAAQIATGETPEADPNVAHIDTVNGRDEYAPGPFAETVLNIGGTIVVDGDGDPHVTDVPLGVPTGPGTLITADGKRHRFTGGTAHELDAEDTDTDDR